MSSAFTWFATKNDAQHVIDWLREAGACPLSGASLTADWEPDGCEYLLHFASIGPVVVWPAEIQLADYEENSPRWRRAVVTKVRQDKSPGQPQLDADQSAVAGLRLPEFRDNRYWVAGHVWFPTARLKEVFPELDRIRQRFERFLKKHPVVFDNTRGEDACGYANQICQAGILHRIYALPEAFELLRQGAFMVDYLRAPKCYAEFRRRLQESGQEK